MNTDLRRIDPVRYVVGSILLWLLSLVLVGLAALPAVGWAFGQGQLLGRVALAVVVGYGFVTSQAFLLSEDDHEPARDVLVASKDLAVSVAFYTVAVGVGAVAVWWLGTMLGLSTDTILLVGVCYPWWEEATTRLPVSGAGLVAYLVAGSLTVWDGEASDGDWLGRGARFVDRRRAWPGTLFGVDDVTDSVR